MNIYDKKIMTKAMIKKIKPSYRAIKIREVDKPTILMRIARGDKYKDIVKDYNIKSYSTLDNLKKNNKQLLEKLREKYSEKIGEIEERIMFKLLYALDKKLERVEMQPVKLDKMKATEFTTAYKDLFIKRQMETAPAFLEEDYKTKDIKDIKEEIKLILRKADTGDSMTLIKTVFSEKMSDNKSCKT